MDTLDLFPQALLEAKRSDGPHRHFYDVVERYGYRLDEVDIGDVTFQQGQIESIHRWYRLTPSFSPSFVRYFLEQFHITSSSFVLDPFSGRGTTIIECQKNGIPALGVEINPLLSKVGELSLNWMPIKSDLFNDYLSEVRSEIHHDKKKGIDAVIKRLGVSLPNIHDVFRWWKPEVLKELIIAREVLRKKRHRAIFHYLWMAVNSSALECANIHRNHPTITFDDDHDRKLDAFCDIESRLQQIQNDLDKLSKDQKKYVGRCSIVYGDACKLEDVPKSKELAVKEPGFVITSPPYPNRFSYVHQTRPQLYFMEVVAERGDATEIDLNSVGGTWGKATSDLMRDFISPPSELEPILDYIPLLKPKSTLMCNYATKYFVDLDRHIQSLKRVAKPGFRAAYLVGNSRLSGVEIFTECILARLFERHGFTVERIVLFRKRGGRQRLNETAVCVKG